MNRKKGMILFLAGLLAAGTLHGCGKNNDIAEGEQIEKPVVLTHVYKGEDLELSEEYYVQDYLGIKDDCFVFLGSYYHEEGDWESEDYFYEQYPVLCYSPMDGGELKVEKIEGREYVNTMALFDGGYMILDNRWDETTMQSSFSLEINMDDGTVQTLENLASFFSSANEYFYMNYICRDGEGYTYLIAEQEIAVLKPDLTLECTIMTDNWINSVDTSTDGSIYVSYWSYNEVTGTSGQVFAPIDRGNKTIGEPITLPENIRADSFFFGPSYEVYYYNETGIYGYNTGDTDGTLLMHFENSDITGDLDMVKVVDADSFLLQYYDRITWDRRFGVFNKADDIDLSQIQVLELAMTANHYDVPTLVVAFNRNHTDARIVTTDYSRYNTEDNPDAGNTKLASDILNGLYHPDMICGYYRDAGYRAVLENDLFLDLYTFLKTDAKLPESDLLGCVKNTFQRDGKLYGLPMSISLNTVIANKSMVGNRDSWTVEEMVDFIKNLPEGVEFMTGMTQNSAAYNLLGEGGYAAFIDMEAGKCSFDGDAFIAYLEFLKTMPKELPDDYYMTQNEDRYGPYKTGKVAAATMYYHGVNSFLEEKVYFGEDNTAWIGTPVSDGYSGVRLNSYINTFTILADTANPELCWNFIRDAVISSNSADEMRGSDGIPMLRSYLEAMKEEYKDTTFIVHYDGGMSWGSGYTPDESELENGEVFRLTDADWAHIETFLDTVGAPMTNTTLPEDVLNIINEELSAYLDGNKPAADCASMIQSRVSLYLAENS